MPYIEPTSYRDCASRLVALGDRLLATKHSGPYSDEDARGVALSNCRMDAFSSVMVLNLLSMGEEGRCTGDDFKALIGMTSGDVEDAVYILDKTTRLGFITLFQFQIENLCRNLLRPLGVSLPTGFYNIAAALIGVLNLPDAQRKLDVLNVLARMRNSLHANGIHHDPRQPVRRVDVDGFVFEFIDGRKVSCAGWGHCAHAASASAAIVEEALAAPAVRSLTDPIEDQYAWEMATAP